MPGLSLLIFLLTTSFYIISGENSNSTAHPTTTSLMKCSKTSNGTMVHIQAGLIICGEENGTRHLLGARVNEKRCIPESAIAPPRSNDRTPCAANFSVIEMEPVYDLNRTCKEWTLHVYTNLTSVAVTFFIYGEENRDVEFCQLRTHVSSVTNPSPTSPSSPSANPSTSPLLSKTEHNSDSIKTEANKSMKLMPLFEPSCILISMIIIIINR